MGEHTVNSADGPRMRAFTRALLMDLKALDQMIREGRFETGVRRIGAEQEMFLVDGSCQPAPLASAILSRINQPRLVHELALYNLEANLDPLLFGDRCLRQMEQDLNEVVDKARKAARELDGDVLLTGILPTLRLSHLGMDNMTPSPRYFELNRVCSELNNSNFNIIIKGLDDLDITHDNVMLESANTSFQVHFQVGPEEFPRLYNLTQAVSAPVLAAAVNSPVLMGRRLWRETRVALFQHSVDSRSRVQRARSTPPRVSFGDQWVRSSVLEIFKENIARFRILLASEQDEDPSVVLARGEAPSLKALRMHAGTVWRWNRPCYGISDNGIPHLRIENRILPAGPTVIDEVANAAFYFGLMASMGEAYPDIHTVMEFDDAKNNFFAAARHGLKAQFTWVNGESFTARELITSHLLPLAREGLKSKGIDSSDIDRYLGTVQARVERNQTGARWALKSLAEMKEAPSDVKLRSLASATKENQVSGRPVHEWPLARLHRSQDWFPSYRTVGQFMNTDLVTVRPDDLMELAVSVMDWQRVRHVPVENDTGRLVGMLSFRSVIRMINRRSGLVSPDAESTQELRADDSMSGQEEVTVEDVMRHDPTWVKPETSTLEALRLMRRDQVSSLPVVDADHRLVGLVTSYDFMDIASRLLEDYLDSGLLPAPTPSPELSVIETSLVEPDGSVPDGSVSDGSVSGADEADIRVPEPGRAPEAKAESGPRAALSGDPEQPAP